MQVYMAFYSVAPSSPQASTIPALRNSAKPNFEFMFKSIETSSDDSRPPPSLRDVRASWDRT